MEEEGLRFPDQRRSELERTIGELLEHAQQVLTAQGRLRHLLRATQAVVEGLDLAEVLRHITEAAVALVDARYGALGVIDREGRLEQFIHVGIPEDDSNAIGHLPEGHGILGAVIRSKHAIRLDDLGSDPRSVGFPAHHPPMSTFLGVPIRVRGEIYGNLYLTNRAGGVFTDEDEELVIALASTAAIAIDNARSYEESRRSERLSSSLVEINAALLAPDSGDVFGVVAERVAALIRADTVFIVVPGAVGSHHRVQTARGAGAELIEGADVPGGDSLVPRVMASGASGATVGLLDLPSFGGQSADAPIIAVPLVVAGMPDGALCAIRSSTDQRFSEKDLETLAEFAAQTGVALALAQARADRQRLDVVEDRARIARDLHDNVIQRLFGTGLGLQALAASLPAHEAAITAHVDEIDGAIGDFRTAIFSLQSTDSGSIRHRLLDVVTELASSLAAMPRLSFAGPVDHLVTGGLADDVVAVVRESLSNVSRHAGAQTAEVALSANESDVTVVVDDDGRGMPAEPGRASGTVNLIARAREYGGDCTFDARETGGTRVRWCVPLRSKAETRR